MKSVVDIKAMAKELEYVLDVYGYKLSEFGIDILTGTLNIRAKEKTAETATSTVSQEKV